MTESRIPALRRERGWTQERLAVASGLGVRTVQRIEAGGAIAKRRRRWPVVLAALAIVGGAGGTIGAGLLPARADATVRAHVSVVEPATLLPPRSYQEQLVASVAAVATTPLVLQEADRHLAAPSGQQALGAAVTSRVLAGNRIVVTARAGSGPAALERADVVLDALITELPRLTPTGGTTQVRITRVGRPTQNDPHDLDLLAGGGIGTAGGLLAGALLAAAGSRAGRSRPEGRPRVAVA